MTCNHSNGTELLSNLTGTGPIDAVVCPYVADWGAGIPIGVFTMLGLAGVGLSIGIWQESPMGPIIVGIFGAPLIGTLVPGLPLKVFTLIMLATITVGLYIVYSRSRRVL